MGEQVDNDLLSSFLTSAWVPSPDSIDYLNYHEWTSSNTTIVTSYSKKKVVDDLHDYWKVKGLLLRIKRSPALILDLNYLKVIIEFLEKHTQLPQIPFWNRLNLSQKYAITKRFVIVEGRSQKQYISTSTSSPEVFIVLSGTVEAKVYDDTTENDYVNSSFGHGVVFGSVDNLNQVLDNTIRENQQHRTTTTPTFSSSSSLTAAVLVPVSVPSSAISSTMNYITKFRISACVSMCTLFRLSLKDYMIEVSPPKSELEDMDEEELLMVTKKLKREDVMCIRFCKQSEKTLSKTLYDFLVEYNILPQSSLSPSYQYMRVGNIGRSILLSKEECKLVYIVIDGSMRLQIIKPKSNHNKISPYYEISCHREGHYIPLEIKTTYLPVMIIEMGSVFVVNEECFKIKTVDDTNKQSIVKHTSSITNVWPNISKIRKGSDTTNNGSNGTNLTNGQRPPSQGNILHGIQLPPINENRSNLQSRSNSQQQQRKRRSTKHVDEEDLYQIEVVFDKTTKYLAIPRELFKKAMKETSVDTNKEITRQLNQISASLVHRITSMLPWINGKKDLWLQDKPRKEVIINSNSNNISTFPSHDHQVINEQRMGPASLAAIGIDGTYGSFVGVRP